MPRRVKIAPGYKSVALPNNLTYDENTVVTLSDEEFSAVQGSAIGVSIIDLGSVAGGGEGGGGGHVIKDDGVALEQRTGLNFVGPGVTVADDVVNGDTRVTIGGGFVFRGAWAAATDYAENDVVTRLGSVYRVASAHTSGASFGTANLELWASKGDPGANGAPGVNGAPGPKGDQGNIGPEGPEGPTGPGGPPGAIGPVGPVGPAGLTWRGPWAAPTSYFEDDVVGYNGAAYFALGSPAPSAGTPPTDGVGALNTGWALLAAQGADGPQGPRGLTGPTGPPGITGAQGPAGPQGVKGDPGDPGANGQDGAAGPAGPEGPRGLPGEAGVPGPAGPGLPAGGTQGQVPIKASATNYDVVWGAVSGGHTIQDEGTSVAQREVMNFVGDGVSVADAGGKTVVTVSGAGGVGTDTTVQERKSLIHDTHQRNTTMGYTGGNLTSITEKSGTTTIKTTTLSYTGDNLTQTVEVAGGVTVTTTLAYDGSGVLTGTTRVVS